MARKMYFPDNRARSATAVAGKADIRDDDLYSSVVLAHGGQGNVRCFTVPQGQSIPELKGSGTTATTQAHQLTHSDSTTNFQKAGEPGSNIGDVAVKSISVTFEQAAVTLTTGQPRSFGATQFEVQDVLAKCSMKLIVAGKVQKQSALHHLPSYGGASGSLSTTGNAATAGIVQNGALGMGRQLKVPILIARNDTLVGEITTGNGALAFSTTTGEGQPFLLWVTLLSGVKGDVR